MRFRYMVVPSTSVKLSYLLSVGNIFSISFLKELHS